MCFGENLLSHLPGHILAGAAVVSSMCSSFGLAGFQVLISFWCAQIFPLLGADQFVWCAQWFAQQRAVSLFILHRMPPLQDSDHAEVHCLGRLRLLGLPAKVLHCR
jgi:hypothetical protein